MQPMKAYACGISALVNEFDKQNYSFYCKLNFVNGFVVVVVVNMMLHRMLYE